MIRLSTGLRNAVATNYGLGIMMNNGVIYVYDGTIPDSPDDAPTSNLLGKITTGGLAFVPGNDTIGAGLNLTFVSVGGLKNTGNWILTGSANGVPTWFRWCWAGADDLTASTYYPRVDGVVGPNGPLTLAISSITPTTSLQVDQFLLILPTGNI